MTRKDNYAHWAPEEAERLRVISRVECQHPATVDVCDHANGCAVICTSCGQELSAHRPCHCGRHR